MRYLNLLIIAAAGLILTACPAKHMQLTGFDIEVKDVHSTKAKVVIVPSNPDAYYCYGKLDNVNLTDYFNMTDEENAAFQMDFSKERWELICEEEGYEVPFEQIYCYQGTQEIDYTYLIPDADHKIVVFQVDPKAKQFIGTPVSKVFHTNPLVMSDLSFKIGLDKDMITITPSSRDSYCFDYNLTEDILEEYAGTEFYFRNLVDMWEDFGLIEGRKVRGPASIEFSSSDPTIQEGARYSFAISGYEDFEINTAVTTFDFIYHKDIPCEMVKEEE